MSTTWVSGYMFYDARAQGAGEMFHSGPPKFYYFRAERLLAALCILCVPWWDTWQHLWGFASFISPGEVSKGGDSTGVKENKIWNTGIRRECFKQKGRWGKSMHSCGFYGNFLLLKKFLFGFCFDSCIHLSLAPIGANQRKWSRMIRDDPGVFELALVAKWPYIGGKVALHWW